MDLLIQKYKELIKLCNIDEDFDKKYASLTIRNILDKFCPSHKNVTIWCTYTYVDDSLYRRIKNINTVIMHY